MAAFRLPPIPPIRKSDYGPIPPQRPAPEPRLEGTYGTDARYKTEGSAAHTLGLFIIAFAMGLALGIALTNAYLQHHDQQQEVQHDQEQP